MDFVRSIDALIPGAQGRILAVLAETTAELNLRTIAKLAGVSSAQASRVLPGLVALGVVERHEVPPASLFRLVPDHVASRVILDLAASNDRAITEIGKLVETLPISPVSVIVFGSLARREARAESDIDVVVVRPIDIEGEDDRWSEALEQWRTNVRRLTGNPVDMLDVGEAEIAQKLASKSSLWVNVQREGKVVYGRALDELRSPVGA